jgi:hypothetical protein
MEELNDAESGSCKLEEFLFVRMIIMLENMFGRVFAVRYGVCQIAMKSMKSIWRELLVIDIAFLLN